MDSAEALLVQQLRNGEDAAYKYLYDQHYQILCHVAAQYVKDDFLAETIVGDVIFHLWEVRETIEINTSVRSYLMSCVRHRCIDYLKSQHHQHEIAQSNVGMRDFPVLQYVKDSDYPLGRLLEKELENEIMNAISRLPDECRKVFNMSRFENRKYEEIAQELQISINTVKYHIKHALALLHEDLGKYLAMVMMILVESMS